MLGTKGYKVLRGSVRVGGSEFALAFKEAHLPKSKLDPQNNNNDSGDYKEGGTVNRKELQKGVYDVAAGAPAAMPVQFHNELSYHTHYPRYVGFGCYQMAEKGGTTRLARMDAITESLCHDIEQKLKNLGIRYIRNLGDRNDTKSPSLTNWQDTFNTENIDEARKNAEVSVTDHDDFIYNQHDNTVTIHLNRQCFLTDPETNKQVLNISVMDFYDFPYDVDSEYSDRDSKDKPLHCLWGDGSEMSVEEVQYLKQLYEDHSEDIKLNTGDGIVVDNLLWAHGRHPYEGDRLVGLILSELLPRRTPSIETRSI